MNENGSELTKDEKTWGMFCHLASLAGFVGVPLGNIVGPLVVWLIKKDEMDFVDYNGKEALNFQITVAIAIVLCIPLAFILIGFFLIIGITVLDILYTVIAAMKANEGVRYRYPFSIRLIN